MRIHSYTVGLTIIVVMFILIGCSKSNQASDAECSEAKILGAQRASELASETIGTDTLAIEKVIIDVREREMRLRRAGQDAMADSYINGFIEKLDSVNPSLSKELH